MRGLALSLILLSACGPFTGPAEEEAAALDPDEAREVVQALLVALEEAYAKEGPAFAARIPEIKNEVAQAREFKTWDRVSARLRKTDPDRDVEVAGEITRTINALLARSTDEEAVEDR